MSNFKASIKITKYKNPKEPKRSIFRKHLRSDYNKIFMLSK